MPLDELNEKLHSRDFHADRMRKPDTFRPDENQADSETVSRFQKTEEWDRSSLPQKELFPLPVAAQEFISDDPGPKNRRKFIAIVLGSIACLLLVGGIVMKLRTGIFSEENIILKITGPSEVKSAEAVTFAFEYTNDNWMGLDESRVVFEYPETFHPEPAAGLDIRKSRAEMKVGMIAPQKRGTVILSGKFYGLKGDQVEVTATLRYTPSAITSAYEKRAGRSVSIVSSAISFEIAAPRELADGNETEYEVRYKNEGDTTVPDLKVKLEYPVGFTFASAEPRPFDGDAVFDAGSLAPGQEGKILIRGTLSGTRDDQKTIHGGIGIFQGDGTFVAYGDHQRQTRIVASPFTIRQTVNGQVDPIIAPGGMLTYEINYKNEGNVGIRDAIVTIDLDSPYLDFKTLEFSLTKGAYSQTRKGITWKASDIPELARVTPGQSGKLLFTIKTYTDPQNRSDATDPVIRSVAKIDSPDLPAIIGQTKVVASNTLTTKIQTEVITTLRGYYQDLVIPNFGPIPPVVGQETTYAFHLEATSTTNAVERAQLSILLPSGIRYTGKKGSESEKLVWNERTNELVWDLNILKPGEKREIVFQIAVTPDPSSIGSDVTLIGRTTLTGKNIFTGQDVRLEKEGKTSRITDDSTVPISGYVVVPASP